MRELGQLAGRLGRELQHATPGNGRRTVDLAQRPTLTNRTEAEPGERRSELEQCDGRPCRARRSTAPVGYDFSPWTRDTREEPIRVGLGFNQRPSRPDDPHRTPGSGSGETSKTALPGGPTVRAVTTSGSWPDGVRASQQGCELRHHGDPLGQLAVHTRASSTTRAITSPRSCGVPIPTRAPPSSSPDGTVPSS